MEPLTVQQIAVTCGGEVRHGDGATVIRRVGIDSRHVEAGDLFVGIRGERFDGHAYAMDAVRRGAVAVLGEPGRFPEPWPSCAVILVSDSRRALGALAAAHRRRFELPVIAVAGSNGKTTTKELIASVLRQRRVTLASEASYNNDIGVPLSLLKLEARHEAAVLETGTNHPGELAPLLQQIRPRYGVLTSLGREHLEFFTDFAGVCAEEGSLAEALPPDGILFANGDTPGLAEVVRRSCARVVKVGLQPDNEWRAAGVRLDANGTTFRLTSPRADWRGEYRLRLVGRHQATNALLALAVGAELGLTREEIARGLAECPPPKMRLEIREVNGIRVLDDCYNANADSVLAALDTLREMAPGGRRLAVLGDMEELGAHSQAAHAEVGVAAARLGVDGLIAVGRMAGVVAEAARSHGLADAWAFAEVEPAAVALLAMARRGDHVLVKASRAARLERLIERLREAPFAASEASPARCCTT